MDELYERKRIRKSAPLIDSKLSCQLLQLHCTESDNRTIPKEVFSTRKGDASDVSYKKKGRKVESKNTDIVSEPCSKIETVGTSVTRIEKVKRKTELCKRHVPQLLVRGEHVVSIVLL